MQKFRRILFASEGLTDDSEALSQALRIAHDNKAELEALIVCPEFPEGLAKYREKYEASLAQGLTASIQAAREKTGVNETEIPVQIEVESGSTRSGRIIRHVHHLVSEEAECMEGGKACRAADMKLLRKCPCAVWLSRPISKHWAY